MNYPEAIAISAGVLAAAAALWALAWRNVRMDKMTVLQGLVTLLANCELTSVDDLVRIIEAWRGRKERSDGTDAT